MFLIDEKSMQKTIEIVHSKMIREAPEIIEFDKKIKAVLIPSSGVISESELRRLVEKIHTDKIEILEQCKKLLTAEMNKVGNKISGLWNDDRYVRENFGF